MTKFDTYLNEKLKDPSFKKGFEKEREILRRKIAKARVKCSKKVSAADNQQGRT